MKIIAKILLVIAAIFAILLLVALVTKKDYSVEREVVINKPKQEVFDYVKHIKNQDNYSKWSMMDPNSKRDYKGTDGTVGFVSAWDSQMDDVGKGEQEIKSIAEGERIDLELRFIKPWEGNATAYMTTESVGDNQTKVKWGFSSKMPYPMNLMLLFMNMDKMLGPDLQTGLDNLKGVIEKQ